MLSSKACNTNRLSKIMESNTMAMSIKMGNFKELESLLCQMDIRKEKSGIRINYMVLPRLHMQMVTLFGGNARIITRKDMEHMSGLMETDTLGSGCRMSDTAMEYKQGQMEVDIKDNGNKVLKKVMHIKGGQVALSIMDSTRIISSTEKESNKRKAFNTHLNIKMTRLSAK